MAFIDEQRLGVGLEAVDSPLIGMLGRPDLGRENVCRLVLHDTRDVGGYAFAHAAGPVDHHLVELAVLEVVGGKLDFPHAVADGAEAVFHLFAPLREVADEGDCRGVGRPFAEDPAAVGLAVKTEIFVGISKIIEVAGAAGQLGFLVDGVLMTAGDGLGIGLEPGVVLNYRQHGRFAACSRAAGFGRCSLGR